MASFTLVSCIFEKSSWRALFITHSLEKVFSVNTSQTVGIVSFIASQTCFVAQFTSVWNLISVYVKSWGTYSDAFVVEDKVIVASWCIRAS
jgi:hypothetical protein